MKNTAELLKFEWQKICGKRIVQISLILMLFIVPVTMFISAFFSTTMYEEETLTIYELGQRQQETLTPLNGTPMDDAFFRGDVKSDKDLAAISAELGESIHADGAESYYRALDREFLKLVDYYHLSNSEKDYWNTRWKTVTRPYVYGYVGGAESRCQVFYSVIAFSIFVIAVCLSQVYAEEHRRKTDTLILCSTNGRTRLYSIKFFAGILFGVLVSLIQAAEYVLMYGILDGFGGGEFQIQVRLAYVPYPFTFRDLFLILCGLYLLSAVLVSAFTLLLSELTKNALSAMIVPIVILFATLLYEIPETHPVLNAIEQYIPGNNLGVWQVYNLWTVPLGFTRLDFFQSAAILYAVLTVLFFFVGRMRYVRTEI